MKNIQEFDRMMTEGDHLLGRELVDEAFTLYMQGSRFLTSFFETKERV